MPITVDLLKPDAAALSVLALALGLLELACALPCLLFPGAAARALRGFPRAAWPGWILTSIALVWSALWIWAMPFQFLAPVKSNLWILTPVAIVAVAIFVDELLSCRALGGVLVLLPAPLLSAAQWHPSPWRYLVLILAYLCAISGMYIIAAPFRLRDALHWLADSPRALRWVAALDLALGLLLGILALTAYRLT